MSSSVYDIAGAEPELPRGSRRPSSPTAPNHSGLVLLGVMLLMLAVAVFGVGLPALESMREQTTCVTTTDGGMQSADRCAR